MLEWRAFASRVRGRVRYYRALASHERTPCISKWLIGLAIAYLMSPVDLIPDFIPVLGHLDDLLIVPGLIAIALLLVPEDVKSQARMEEERSNPDSGRGT